MRSRRSRSRECRFSRSISRDCHRAHASILFEATPRRRISYLTASNERTHDRVEAIDHVARLNGRTGCVRLLLPIDIFRFVSFSSIQHEKEKQEKRKKCFFPFFFFTVYPCRVFEQTNRRSREGERETEINSENVYKKKKNEQNGTNTRTHTR